MQKAVAIFGATSSIGSSVAGRFLADGFVVHATGRNQQKLAELTKSAGRSVIHSHTLDILDDASIQSTAQNIRRSCSQLDHRLTSLVYCVGVRRDQLLMRSSDHDLQLTLDSNLLGALRVCKHMAKVMIGKGGTSSSIVLIGSVVGELGNVGQASYASSKAGLIGLTRSLALELSPKHITVNLVSPGYVDTDFIGDLDLNQIRGQVPSGRIASPHDVAAAVHFLALSPSITGQNLFVDGGLALSGINFNN